MEDPLLGAIRWSVLFGLLVVCAYTDLVQQKVYNWATLPAILLGVGLAWAAERLHPGSGALQASLIGLALGFGVFFVAHLVGGIGGGDVKLMAAIGALAGMPLVVDAMFWAVLAGAILAAGRLSLEGRLLEGIRASARHWFSLGGGDGGDADEATEATEEAGAGRLTVPYGLAIACGTLWAFAIEVVPVAGA